MNFQPRTEEECDTRTLLANGEYAATVIEASNEHSKASGKEQIHLLLLVESEDGGRNKVHDYLLEAMPGKLRHFCEAAGLMSEYESGRLSASDCSGQDVRVKLIIEKGKDQYPDKNVVRDYLAKKGADAFPAAKQSPVTGPTPQGGEGPAKKAFMVQWNRFLGEFPAEASRRDIYWNKCFSEFFPGKTVEQIGTVEWEKFRLSVARWDPVKGWPKPQATPPFTADSEFKEDDIPF